MDTKEKEVGELYARLDDLRKRAIQGKIGVSAFLSPRELHYGEAYLLRTGAAFLSFGGYIDAERKRIYVLPEYMEDVTDARDFSDFGYETSIAAISVSGSGFRKLSHRDFMGSLLGLGIQRGVVGDIVLTEDDTATVFCDENIVAFLLTEWQKVGSDKVKVFQVKIDSSFAPQRKYITVSDTVASARIDCVVSALCSISREKAKELILNGSAEMNYEIEERPDREVIAGSVLSVRGYGKFKIVSISDKTKKGRFRLLGEKYL